MPLKIDPLIFYWYQGMFARIYVNVDLSKPLPKKNLVALKNLEKRIDVKFFCYWHIKVCRNIVQVVEISVMI